MPGNLLFIFDHPIICRTFEHTYIDQSDDSSKHVLHFYTANFGRVVADWSIENMTPNMT